MNMIRQKTMVLFASIMLLFFSAGFSCYAETLSGRALAAKDKILKDSAKAEAAEADRAKEALKRKIFGTQLLDAQVFPDQLVSFNDKRGNHVVAVDSFSPVVITLTNEQVKSLNEWANSVGYDNNVNDIPQAVSLCNMLSELCGLTPVYRRMDDGSVDRRRIRDSHWEVRTYLSFYGAGRIPLLHANGFRLPEHDGYLAVAKKYGKIQVPEKGALFLICKQGSVESNAGEQ